MASGMIDRMGEAAKTSAAAPKSRQGTVIALIAGNLVPLFGVLFFGWSVLVTFLIFWIENVLIGFYTVLRISMSQRNKEEPGKPATFGHRLHGALFFICLYGIFTLAHGAVVLGLFATVDTGSRTRRAPDFDELMTAISPDVLAFAALALLITRGMEFYLEFVRPRAYATAAFEDATTGPIGRMILLHVALIGGGALAMQYRSPVLALVVLIVLKTAGELIFSRVRTKAG